MKEDGFGAGSKFMKGEDCNYIVEERYFCLDDVQGFEDRLELNLFLDRYSKLRLENLKR